MAPRKPRAPRSAVAVLAAVATAMSLGGCSSSPSTTALEAKLRQVSGLTAQQAHCVAVSLEHSLSSGEMRTVASADGRGGITDAKLTEKVTTAVSACGVASTTTLGQGGAAPVTTLEP